MARGKSYFDDFFEGAVLRLTAKGEWRAAIKTAKQMEEYGPTDEHFRMLVIRSAALAGDYEDAKRLIEADKREIRKSNPKLDLDFLEDRNSLVDDMNAERTRSLITLVATEQEKNGHRIEALKTMAPVEKFLQQKLAETGENERFAVLLDTTQNGLGYPASYSEALSMCFVKALKEMPIPNDAIDQLESKMERAEFDVTAQQLLLDMKRRLLEMECEGRVVRSESNILLSELQKVIGGQATAERKKAFVSGKLPNMIELLRNQRDSESAGHLASKFALSLARVNDFDGIRRVLPFIKNKSLLVEVLAKASIQASDIQPICEDDQIFELPALVGGIF